MLVSQMPNLMELLIRFWVWGLGFRISMDFGFRG